MKKGFGQSLTPEFGQDEDKKHLIVWTLYELKSAGASFKGTLSQIA